MSDTKKVLVLRSFYLSGGKVVKVGDEIELNANHAAALAGVGKVMDVPEVDDKTIEKVDAKLVKVLNKGDEKELAAALAEADALAAKLDAGMSKADQQVIKDEADAQKRADK